MTVSKLNSLRRRTYAYATDLMNTEDANPRNATAAGGLLRIIVQSLTADMRLCAALGVKPDIEDIE